MKIKKIILLFLCLLTGYNCNSKTKDIKKPDKKQKIKLQDEKNKTNNQKIFSSTSIVPFKGNANNAIERSRENITKNPFVPIEFHQDGLNKFFENIYNKNWYAKDFLPNNFMHMTQFLQYGKNTDQGNAFLKSVIKLFSNKIKASSYVNCYAFLELLEIMPELVKHYFEPPKIDLFEFNKKIVGDLMYKNFLDNFDGFKDNPKIFLENMAEKTLKPFYENANKNSQAELIESYSSLEHLRQEISKFLELSLGKLIWSPYDHQNIWSLFYRTAKAIQEFSDKKIIDDVDNLDDIYWSLIHRFCDFLELSGNDLPTEFYVNFNNKILSSELLMFQIEEQERAITNKETYLVQSILSGQAKMLASKRPANA